MPPSSDLESNYCGSLPVTEKGTDEDALVAVDTNLAPLATPVSGNAAAVRLSIELLLKVGARASENLQAAANVGLKAPLPKAWFEFRTGFVVDLSLVPICNSSPVDFVACLVDS